MYHVGPRLPHVNRDAPINATMGVKIFQHCFMTKFPTKTCLHTFCVSHLHCCTLHISTLKGRQWEQTKGHSASAWYKQYTIKHLHSYSLCRNVLHTERYLDKHLFSSLNATKIHKLCDQKAGEELGTEATFAQHLAGLLAGRRAPLTVDNIKPKALSTPSVL